jgi:hypothetical protein
VRQSEAVAVSLRRGDGCTAARRPRALRRQVRAAIVRGDIPRRLSAPLQASVSSLERRIVCKPHAVDPPPPPPRPRADDEDESGRGKGHDKGKRHGKDGD